MAGVDYGARSTWAGLSETALTTEWEAFVAHGPLKTACPKVGVDFFYYPNLRRKIRGAKALHDIAAGETLCKVPIQALLSVYALRNSSFSPIANHFLKGDPEGVQARARVLRLRQRGGVDHRALLALFAIRESARVSSPYMPYMQMLNTHDTGGIPMLWETNSSRWAGLSKGLAAMAHRSRMQAHSAFAQVVPVAIADFARELSDGLPCASASIIRGGKVCSPEALREVYTKAEYLRLYAIISARDWVLPVYGRQMQFCAPIMDMFNFGQVGIRANFEDTQHAFVAKATQKIAKGTELLFYYGSFCADQWRNMYGFVPANVRSCGERAASAGVRTREAPARALRAPPAARSHRSPPIGSGR